MKAEVEADALLAAGEESEKVSAADDVPGGDSGEADTIGKLAEDEDDDADDVNSGAAEDAAGVAVVAAAEEAVEPAVLVDDSGLVDAMDINMAAADTVLSVMGMTVAAALLPGASLTALAATVARDGEPGELVGAVNVTLAGSEKLAGSFAGGGGDVAGTGAGATYEREAETVGAGDRLLGVAAAAPTESQAGGPVAGGMSEGGNSDVGGRLVTIDTGNTVLDMMLAMFDTVGCEESDTNVRQTHTLQTAM